MMNRPSSWRNKSSSNRHALDVNCSFTLHIHKVSRRSMPACRTSPPTWPSNPRPTQHTCHLGRQGIHCRHSRASSTTRGCRSIMAAAGLSPCHRDIYSGLCSLHGVLLPVISRSRTRYLQVIFTKNLSGSIPWQTSALWSQPSLSN